MEYYCIHHYNRINNTEYTYDEVKVDVRMCVLCKMKTLCVVGFGHEYNPLVEKCKDDVLFVYEITEQASKKHKLKLRKMKQMLLK